MKLIFALSILIFTQAAIASSGWDTYTPTKLEWLTTELNADNRETIYTGGTADCARETSVKYRGEYPNTIVIVVTEGAQAYSGFSDLLINGSIRILNIYKQRRGFDWISYRVEKRVICQ